MTYLQKQELKFNLALLEKITEETKKFNGAKEALLRSSITFIRILLWQQSALQTIF